MLTLAQGELTVKQDVTIDGDRNDDGKEVTLSGNDTSRILHITGYGTEVSLRQLTLTEGKSTARGGAILADGYSALRLTGATVAGNTVVGDAGNGFALGGGIYSLGDLTVTDSSVSGNTAVDGVGGGIWGGRVTLVDSTVADNHADFSAGGISGVRISLSNSTVSDNDAGADGGGIFSGSYGAISLTSSTVTGNTRGYRRRDLGEVTRDRQHGQR